MNWDLAFLWGFAATLVLTTLLSGSRALGFTRMDIPFMLGTAFTADRDRARWVGFLVHSVNGFAFAFFYIALMKSADLTTVWFGALIGLIHGLFVLVVGMTILPSVHPRMASELHGPDPTRLLEPPGFLALNYGRRTPLVSLVSHVIFGAILGFFYH
jgi:uncharacterized membrane protein YagU involved in acid resistance